MIFVNSDGEILANPIKKVLSSLRSEIDDPNLDIITTACIRVLKGVTRKIRATIGVLKTSFKSSSKSTFEPWVNCIGS